MKLRHISTCFVCGKDNPHGLHANFRIVDDRVVGEFSPKEWQEGASGLLHGGLICAVLDEAMVTLINGLMGTDAPTASLEVRFKRPARLNEKLIITAELMREDRRIRYVRATANTMDGALVAQGECKFLGPSR